MPEPTADKDYIAGEPVTGICVHASHDHRGERVPGHYGYETSPGRHLIFDRQFPARAHIVTDVRIEIGGTWAAV